MRVLLFAMTALTLLAGPAAAQPRDPFAPVIAPETIGGTGGNGTASDATGPLAPVGPRSEGLADTGSDVQGWLVIALAIMCVGAGALYLVKLYRLPA